MKIQLNNKLKVITKNIDFSELCITSRAKLDFKDNVETSAITVKAEGTKCPVCWKISTAPCERHG